MDNSQMHAGGILWRAAQDKYGEFEQAHPLSFAWRHENRSLCPRYRKGADGYWFNPLDNGSGKAVLSCTGDLMCEPLQHKAYRFGDTYFFHPGFRYVRGVLRASDLAMGNLETTLTDCTPYAGEHHRIGGKYHCNAPACYLEAIRYAGFDVLVNANNHNCDSGAEGLMDTLDAMDRYQFMHTGTFHPQNDERVLLVRVNGIRLAILSYATDYNRLDGNLTEAGRNRLLNAYTPEKAAADIQWVKDKGAEFVLVYMHWGVEYTHTPNDTQHRYACELADRGADYIVGSHTHCLQGGAAVTAADGRTVPVIYSMGNFITNEKVEVSTHTGILQLILERKPDGTFAHRSYFVPCFVFKQIGTASFAPVPTDYVLSGGVHHEKLASARQYVADVMCSAQMPLLQSPALSLGAICDALGSKPKAAAASQPCNPRFCTAADSVCEGSVYLDTEQDAEAVQTAWNKGAAAVITEQSGLGADCICVSSVQAAYGRLCAAVCKRFSAKQVLVDGFYGKEQALRFSEAVLKGSFIMPPLADGGAAVLDLSALRPYHEICLQETKLHTDTKALSCVLAPHACVLTGFAPKKTPQKDLQARLSALAAGLVSGGVLLVNGDDAAVMAAAAQLNRSDISVRCYGIRAEGLTYRADEISTDKGLLAFTMTYDGGTMRLSCRTPSEEQVYSILAAAALGLCLGVLPERVQNGLQLCDMQTIRPFVFSYCGLNVMADCACESAASVTAALSAFGRLSASGRHIAVLGGACFTDRETVRRLGKAVADSAVDRVIFCGAKGKKLAEAVSALGGRQQIDIAENWEETETLLLRLLDPRDALLLCGSEDAQLKTVMRRLFAVTDGSI